MEGRDPHPDRVAYAEPFLLDIPTRTVVSDRYQLIYDLRTGEKQLFDIRGDPGARTELTAREPALTTRLLAALEERRSRVAEANARAGSPVPEPARVDEATRRQLRALGYLQ